MLPPGRPSARHLDFVRPHVAATRTNAHIAILGSTPELRDLCVEEQRPNVHVLERSDAFHRACTPLLVFDNPRETLHRGRWQDLLPSLPATFDRILSDLTLGSIPYDERTDFFASLRSALRPGGVFVDKVLTHDEQLLSLDSLDAKYSRAPLNLQTTNDFANEYFFLSELVAEGIVDIRMFRETLAARFASSPRLQHLLDDSLNLVTSDGVWYYGKPWRETQRDYARGMRVIDEGSEPAPGVFAGYLRLFALSPECGER
jgi:hypothetical protein